MDARKAAQRVKQALKQKKVTQDDLAKKLEVSRAAVGHWTTGERPLDRETVDRIAKALHVDSTWLAGETAPEAATSTAGWHFPVPIAGQRDFGNANMYSFKAKIDTLTREAGQNGLDARDDASSAIVMRYRLIELTGADVQAFCAALGWDDLRAHIEASCANKGKSKLARLLAAGLERVDKNPGRLLLLRIDDFGTIGLDGDEAGSGSFAALVRNNLDSEKGSTTAGGSFGLGKGVHWICSDIKTVLFNTVTATHRARVIARSELTYHAFDGKEHAGPGWFGNLGEEQFAESIADEELAARLHLARDPLPKELKELVPHEHGTSILIVAFQDPASEELDEPTAIVDNIEQAVALNFWPAIRRKRLAVVVEHQLNSQIRSQKIVDPTNLLGLGGNAGSYP
jgi:RNA polymerase primary sigma factor